MSSIRPVFVVLCLVIAVLVLPGCFYPPPITLGLPDHHRVCIGDRCETTDCAGTVDELIEVERGDLVTFCNETGCTIKIHFEFRELFAREWLVLPPGRCETLRVMSTARDRDYILEVYGDCCPAAPIGNPEIRVGGGGG